MAKTEYGCNRLVIFFTIRSDFKYSTYIKGPRSNLKRLHNNTLYVDGTFSAISQIQRTVDEIECNYSQAVLINDKLEAELNGASMVKADTLFCVMMEEKSKESYIEMWQVMEEIYFSEYPMEPVLAPRKFVLDFEASHINAIRYVFPESQISNCSFHLIANCNKKLKKYFTTGLENETVKQIWTYCKGIPYVRWNRELVEEFDRILKKTAQVNKTRLMGRYRRANGAQKKLLRQEVKVAKEIIASTDKMIEYLHRTYLSNSHDIFSYENWSIFYDIKDKTNNTSEVSNKQFNEFVLESHRGYTSFRRFVHMATRFITGRMDDEMVIFSFVLC